MKPGILGRHLYRFLKLVSATIPLEQRVRMVRCIDSWVLRYSLTDRLNRGSDDAWAAELFEIFFRDAADEGAAEEGGGVDDDAINEQPRSNTIVGLMRPLFRLVDSARADLVFKHRSFNWKTRGKLFVLMKFNPAAAPHCATLVRLLRDNPTMTDIEFGDVFLQLRSQVAWQNLLPCLLDESWPADHSIQAGSLVSERFRTAFGYIYVPTPSEDEEARVNGTLRESVAEKEDAADDRERDGIRAAARALFRYPSTISTKQFTRFFRSAYNDDIGDSW